MLQPPVLEAILSVVVAAGLRMVSVGVDSGLLTPRGQYLPGVDAQAVLVTSPEHLAFRCRHELATLLDTCCGSGVITNQNTSNFSSVFNFSKPQPRRQQLHLWYLLDTLSTYDGEGVRVSPGADRRKVPCLAGVRGAIRIQQLIKARGSLPLSPALTPPCLTSLALGQVLSGGLFVVIRSGKALDESFRRLEHLLVHRCPNPRRGAIDGCDMCTVSPTTSSHMDYTPSLRTLLTNDDTTTSPAA